MFWVLETVCNAIVRLEVFAHWEEMLTKKVAKLISKLDSEGPLDISRF